jgi:hypothetical protein
MTGAFTLSTRSDSFRVTSRSALIADAELQALTADPNSPVARWDTYVLQTIPDL